MASFYLRAVCQNRNIWGVEDFQEIAIRHSKYAAHRFAHEAQPALTRFAESSPRPFIEGIRAARERIVARNDEERETFLRKRGFSKADAGRIIETVLNEEERKPESLLSRSRDNRLSAYPLGSGSSICCVERLGRSFACPVPIFHARFPSFKLGSAPRKPAGTTSWRADGRLAIAAHAAAAVPHSRCRREICCSASHAG